MEGLYGIYHICYLILFIILTIIIFKNVNKVKDMNKFYRIIGIILFILICINRFTATYQNVVVNKVDGYTWWNLLPNTFCGMTSFVMSLALMFGKKNNVVFHCVAYIGFIGGILTLLYPDFLESQTFFDIRSITGLVHHTICVWLLPLFIKTGYMKPELKKWYIMPLGLSLYMSFGIFELDCLNMNKAMQINNPLISGVPITSWYSVGLVAVILEVIFLYLYEKKTKNK